MSKRAGRQGRNCAKFCAFGPALTIALTFTGFVLLSSLRLPTANAQASGLVAAYSFDEGAGSTAADSSGNGRTGTLANGAGWTTGQYGSAVNLDGVNDKVALPSSLDVTRPFTVEAWIFPTSRSDWRAIFSKRASYSASAMRFDIGLEIGTGRVYITQPNSTQTFSYIPPLNTWTHVAVTADTSGTRLYVNGNLQQSLGAFTPGTGSTAPVAIGNTGDEDDPFAGRLDEVRLYSRALTQAEIQSDMNTPIGGGAPPPPPPADTTPPTVSVSSPANGATVSGTISIAASASDNVGVSGVQFIVDGADFGSEDTTAPYSIPWDTTGVPNGPHAIQARARDAAGNLSTSASIAVQVNNPIADTTPPTVSVNSPAGGATVSGTISITASASDNVGISGVQFIVDGADFGAEDTTAPYSIAWDTATAGNGPHTVQARARDAAGNTATTAALFVQVDNPLPDTEPPSTPTNVIAVVGSTSPLRVDISWTASTDNTGVTSYTVFRNGAAIGSTAGTTHADTAAASATSYNYTVAALDAAGNASPQSAAANVTTPAITGLLASYSFDEAAGTVAADGSGNGFTGTLAGPSWVQGKSGSALSFDGLNDKVSLPSTLDVPSLPFTLAAWISPADFADWHAIFSKRASFDSSAMRFDVGLEISSGRVYLSQPDNTLAFSYVPPLNTWTHLAIVADSAGTRLYVNGALQETSGVFTLGTDASAPVAIGNTGDNDDPFAGQIDEVRLFNRVLSDSEILGLFNEPSLPRVVILEPAEGATVVGNIVQVRYQASGDLAAAGVDHVHFKMDNGSEVMDVDFDGLFQFTNVPGGAHTLTATLVRADHTKIPGTEAAVSFTSVVADSVPPTISLTAPLNGATVSGTITLLAEASDDVGVASVLFQVDGADFAAPITAAPYTVLLDTSTLANGAHTIAAVARDVGGNESAAGPVTVTVANDAALDPSVIGLWAAPADWPLVAIHLTLLPTGEVLMWDDHTDTQGWYLWNPNTGGITSFSAVPDNLFCSGHSALADGRIFVVGGTGADLGVGIPDANVYDPATQSWTAAAPMAFPRYYPTAITLPDGRIFVLSGTDICGSCVVQTPEIYNPANSTWTQLNGARLNIPYYPHIFVLPDGRILNTGASEEDLPTRVLDLTTENWTTLDPNVLDGGSAVMYQPGKIMKSGKAGNPHLDQAATNTAYVLDMNQPSPAWRQVGSMAFPRTFHNLTLLPDGTVLVTGGGITANANLVQQAVLEAEIWSPVTEQWRTVAKLQHPRLYHGTALLLPDGRVLVSGSGRPDGLGVNQFTAEVYSPPYLFTGARPTITGAPSLLTYGSAFTVLTPDAARVARVTLLRLGSVTHAFNHEQRFLELSFQVAGNDLQVQAPSGANVAPPGHYMLFLVDTNGVPSVASFVRLPAPTEDSQPPSAPGLLSATGGAGFASLSWLPATDNVGVTGYNVHRSTTAGFTPTTANRIGSVTTTGYTDAGLALGTYFYKVTAQDAAGNVGPASNEASADVTTSDTTPPSPPTGLNAVVGSTAPLRVDLTWNASTDNIAVASYSVFRDGTLLGTTSNTSYQDATVVASTTYTYTVVASDAAGNLSPQSAPASVTTPGSSSLLIAFGFSEGSGTTTADLSGGGRNGTLVNGTGWAAGQFGSALSFDGTDDKLAVPASLDVPSLPFTFMAWINPTSRSDWRAIFSKRASYSASAMRFDIGLEISSGRVYVTQPNNTLTFSYVPPLNTWTHVAIVADATGTQLYVNGTLQQTLGVFTLGTGSTAPVAIGNTGDDDDPFAGRIDEVRLYKRVLTQSEIQAEMVAPGSVALLLRPGPLLELSAAGPAAHRSGL